VEMLTESVGEQLPEKALRYLKTIKSASVEMGHLIDDLLDFSRMGRNEMDEKPVDLDSLVQKTIQSLEMTTQGRNIIWKFAPLPNVMGDSSMLKQAFTNLIGNAIKYSRQRVPAEIVVGTAGEE